MSLHLVNRTEIELRVPSGAQAQVLQERLCAMRADRLEPLLDRICVELSGSQRLDRVDRLELDLGRIAWDDFDRDFFVLLEQALREALGRRLSGQHQGHEQRDAALQLLRCHALTGNLPWWAGRGDAGLLRRQLALLLNTAPTALRTMLHELADDAVALARLERLAGADLFAALLAAAAGAEPEDAGLRSESSPMGAAAVGTTGSAVGAEHAAFRRRLLTALARVPVDASSGVRGRSSAAAWRDFWQVLIDDPAALARLAQLADDDLLAELHAAAGDAAFAGRERRPSALHPDLAAPVCLEPLAEGDPAIVAGAGTAAGPGPVVADEASIRDAGEVGTRPVQTTARRAGATHAPTASFASAGHGSGAVRSFAGASLESMALPACTPPLVARRRQRAVVDLEQLYVDDAGLVLLWPFLRRCFARCELLSEPEPRFATPLAQQHAVGLLSWLTLQDPFPSEHQLALPKLLCGLAPEMPVLPDDGLPAALQSEGRRLMQAVLGHAAPLRLESEAAFRASYLRRDGVLSVSNGTWLLQVERRPQDVLLGRLAWSWAWVSLPWMAGPLQVEW